MFSFRLRSLWEIRSKGRNEEATFEKFWSLLMNTSIYPLLIFWPLFRIKVLMNFEVLLWQQLRLYLYSFCISPGYREMIVCAYFILNHWTIGTHRPFFGLITSFGLQVAHLDLSIWVNNCPCEQVSVSCFRDLYKCGLYLRSVHKY